MSLFFYQLKQAYLSLKQKPGFVFSVVATMGITLGALLCAITLNYLLLVAPLPYPEQDRLFVAEHGFIDPNNNHDGFDFSYPGLVHLYKSKVAFEHAAMLLHGQDVITSHSEQPLINIAFVTHEFHQMIESPLVMGRKFETTEALDSNNPVAVISYNTWQREFDGNEDVLEQKISLSGVSYRIVGVLAKSFYEPELAEIGRETQVWLPWDFNLTRESRKQRYGSTNRKLKFIGLLKEGVSQSQAEQLLTPLVNDRWQEGVTEIDFFKGWSIKMRVRSVKKVILGDSDSIAVMLLAGVVGLILIACTNISNLFISRSVEKQRQIAIQAVVGATQKRLFKAMLAETSLLMFMSTIVALILANIGFIIMQQYMATVLPRVSELALKPITFGSAVLVTLLLSWIFAILKVRSLNYSVLNSYLQSSGKGNGLQVSKNIRQILIACQVTLATVLVFANVSLLKDAINTINAPLGFTTDHISTMRLNFSSNEYPNQEESVVLTNEILEKIKALPQVASISQSTSPLGDFGILTITNLTTDEKYTPNSKWVDENYFDLIEQAIIQGSNIRVVDRRDRANVMVVNQTFAKQLKPDGDVLGLQVSTGRPEPFKIIGIVKDIIVPAGEAKANKNLGVPRVYRANRLDTQTFMIKFEVGQSVSRQDLNTLLAKVDSRYSVFSYDSVNDLLTQLLFTEITTVVATTILVAITIFLAGIGLYGIISYSSQMRRFEIGTRMAIGAKGKDIVVLVFKDNGLVLLSGLAISLIILFGLYLGFGEVLSAYVTLESLALLLLTLGGISLLSLYSCYLSLRKFINKPTIHSLRGAD